jgi:transcriptional regulator with XRE-family HTH domain
LLSTRLRKIAEECLKEAIRIIEKPGLDAGRAAKKGHRAPRAGNPTGSPTSSPIASTASPAHAPLDALGDRIRKIRRRLGLSLAELSSLCSISIAMLSHIERGRTDPSLKSLDRIRHALGVPMTSLFPHPEDEVAPQASPIVRAAERDLLHLADIGLVKYKLSPNEDSDLEVLLLVLEPGGSSGKEPWARIGEKAGLVLSGRLQLAIDVEIFDLGKGDSFQFDSSKPHRFANTGTDVAEVVWIIKSSPLVRQAGV